MLNTFNYIANIYRNEEVFGCFRIAVNTAYELNPNVHQYEKK